MSPATTELIVPLGDRPILDRVGSPTDGASLGNEIRLVARALFSRIFLIIGTTLVALLLCVMFLWLTEPLFGSTAEILIDPRSKQLLDREVAPTGLGSSSLGPDTLLLDSQIEVIQSLSVLEKVIAKHALADDPEFGKSSPNGLTASVANALRWIVRGPQAADMPEETPFDRALRKLQGGLRVDRKGNTYVVAITVRSPDRFKAAAIANSISEIYVNEANGASNVLAGEAASSLSQRLQKLQQEATEADRAVEEYRAQNGLMGTPDVLIIEQQLKDSNSLLTTARAATKDEAARWNAAKAAGFSDLRQPNGGSTLQSPVLAQLLPQLAAVLAQQAEQSSTLLPGHPLAKATRERRQTLERLVAAEIRQIVTRQKVSYDIALRRERDVEAQVNSLEAKAAQLRLAAVKLNQLIADAGMRQTIVRSFMSRAKQAEEQVGLPASTSRVIARAIPASRSASPPVLLLLIGGSVLGAMLGTALAWLMHVLHGTRARRLVGAA